MNAQGQQQESRDDRVICIGAGPAGLTAAYMLTKAGRAVTVIERDPVYVGGISRTVHYKGFLFDIGGHRFFSKSGRINALWDEILGAEFIERPRKSRIYYRGKLFDYPLKASNALKQLGPFEALRCVSSYLRARLFPIRDPGNFEEWVTNKFGHRLFSIFFRTYTEKVWGMKCTEISADWAAQRIKGLSLGKAIWNALAPARKPREGGEVIKTLINSFRYPRRGPGMMWERATEKVRAAGGEVLMGMTVTATSWDAAAGAWTVKAVDGTGASHEYKGAHLVSSAAMRDLIHGLSPKPASNVLAAAGKLRYRDFLVVALIVRDRQVFDDNWIYIHDPQVKVGRIQNFKSWSPEMVPDQSLNCYGMEYFCFEGDALWESPDQGLVELAKRELVSLNLASPDDIIDGHVIRQAKAYPVYDDAYQDHVATVVSALDRDFPTLHLVGRNGMHKYNNQDHAMLTGILVAENIIAGSRLSNPWLVNEDAEYHEEASPDKEERVVGRAVPRRA